MDKYFEIDIELESVQFRIKAKNKTEARKKALVKLSKKNPVNLIRRDWPSNRKSINIDEF